MTQAGLFADRYRLERRLGVGGMATVQLAFDTRLERYVAVKLLAEHLAEDASFVSRFRREALAAARLVHPNIVGVFDFGTDDASGRQFIAMEYVDGQSCAETLKESGPLRPREAVDVLAQACRGLDYAHRNGVVHRDVKPGNLLRNRDRVVKLADFGIAKAAEQSDITKVGSVLGTAAYLAPEVARGEPAGPSSDLYALGVVAYQLLAGRLPYESSSLTDLARMQEAGPPPRLNEINREVPPELAQVVRQSLHPDPARRYGDAATLEDALRGGLRGDVAPPTGTATQAHDTAATQMLSGARTTALPRTGAQPRRRLEPLDEPARPVGPRTGAVPAAAATAPRRTSRARTALTLLLLAVVIAAGVYLYFTQFDKTPPIKLRDTVQTTVQDGVRQFQQLVQDNTK